MNTRTPILLLLCLVTLTAVGCRVPKGNSVEAKRADVRRMRDGVLGDLATHNPELLERVKAAPGYGVFTDLSTKFFMVGSGHGFGMLVDNHSGEETFMRMVSLGGGVGFGIEDFRAIFIFHDAVTMRVFIEQGWEVGGDARGAAMMDGDKGVAAQGQGTVTAGGGVTASGSGRAGDGDAVGAGNEAASDGIEVYEITEHGLVAQAMLKGTKYWADGDLNGR